jgi:hypothetical protein
MPTGAWACSPNYDFNQVFSLAGPLCFRTMRLADIAAEAERLTAHRDALIAQRVGGSAFEEFRVHFAGGLTKDGAENAAAYDRVAEPSEALDMEERRAIIRGGFAISVKAGGYAGERVSVEWAGVGTG